MKLLLIDLDDTLIDTTSHKKEVFSELSKTLNISITQINTLYEEQKIKGHMQGWIKEFEALLSNRLHITPGFLHPILQKTVSKIPINSHVIDYVRKTDAYKVIFSYGDLDYQHLKIKLLDLEKEVHKIIITPDYKLNFLNSIIEEDHVMLNNTSYSDVTIIDNDIRLNHDIKHQYPWINVIDPKDLV